MSSDEKKVLPKIRTFADDFKRSQPDASSATKDFKTPASEQPTKIEVAIPSEPQKITIAPQAAVKKIVVPAPKPKPPLQKVATHKRYSTYLDDLSEIETGSIVRETRRKRFRLFPAIGASLQEWFNAKKEEQKISNVSTAPRVAAPENRKDVLASAASLGVLPETDDHKKISVRLKETPRMEHHSSIAVAGKEAEPTPRWGSLDDEVTLEQEIIHDEAISELEAAVEDPEPVEEVTPEILPIENVITPEPISPVPALDTNIEQTTVTKPEELEPAKIEETPNLITIEHEPEPEVTPEQEEEVPNVIEDAPDEVFDNIPQNQSNYRYRGGDVSSASNNQLSFILLVVILIALIVGVFGTITAYRYLTQPDEILAPKVNTVINADNNISYLISEGSVIETIAKLAMQADGKITQYYPTVVTPAGTIVPATIDEQLAGLALNIPGQLSRSITEMSFGTGSSKSPFIIIVSNNFDTAFAGMLEWEKTLGSDFVLWFGDVPNASFTDVTSNNRDIRLAKRSDGSEIMYTFLSRTTILITTDRAVLENVPGRIVR